MWGKQTPRLTVTLFLAALLAGTAQGQTPKYGEWVGTFDLRLIDTIEFQGGQKAWIKLTRLPGNAVAEIVVLDANGKRVVSAVTNNGESREVNWIPAATQRFRFYLRNPSGCQCEATQ